MIDGYPVRVKDKVFVLSAGNGIVTKVATDGFYVKTSRGESHYRTGGFLGNQRRVFWHNPVFMIPPKNKKLWKAAMELALVVYENLTLLCEFKEDTDEETVE